MTKIEGQFQKLLVIIPIYSQSFSRTKLGGKPPKGIIFSYFFVMDYVWPGVELGPYGFVS